MSFPNVFESQVSKELINRINKLNATSIPLWGKMSVGQMLAHCCVPYEFVFESEKHPPAGLLKSMLLKLFLKNSIVGSKPYPKNSRTAPQFLIAGEREFNPEKERLVGYIGKVQEQGASFYEGKQSQSLGKLSAAEWSAMFYKHLDHHLRQFNV